MPSDTDRSQHLAALHQRWTTPQSVVVASIGEVTEAPILNIRRIVAGEQNEVYDVTLERASPLIVRISHGGSESHDRESWVLGQCASQDIPAPRILGHRNVELDSDTRSILVMDKLPGERLCDLDPRQLDLRQILGDLGEWLTRVHSIPVRGFGYLDASGIGRLATLADWLANLTVEAQAFVTAGTSVGLDEGTVRRWLGEILESFEARPARVTLIHNDLLANHVLVHDGSLAGVIDFGEVAAEPTLNEFAKWDFSEGERFPVEWIQEGYGDPSLFDPADDRIYRSVWLANGLWRMRWYHETGFRAGVEAARDRLVSRPRP